MRKTFRTMASLALVVLQATTASSQSLYVSAGSVSVRPDTTAQNMTLTVSGPDGFFEMSFKKYGTPDVSLIRNGLIADGSYKWELTGHTGERVQSYESGLNNGRGDEARNFAYKSIRENGSFTILGGVRFKPQDISEESKERASSANKFNQLR